MHTDDVDPTPQWSRAGKRNRDLFLLGSQACSVCFYFEDEGAEELYLRFIKRLFPELVKPLVTCVGGKTRKDVLADADTHKLSPVVFVQDKDFDDLIGTLPVDKRVVSLHRYSFENYFLVPSTFVELAIESKRRLRRENVEHRLQIESHFTQLFESYRPLTQLFVVVRRLNLKGIKTTKQSIWDLVAPGSTLVSASDVEKFRARVERAALKQQRIATVEELQQLVANALVPKDKYANHADPDESTHLCGKHLLDLVLAYVDTMLATELSANDRFETLMRALLHTPMNVFDRVRQNILDSIATQTSANPI